MKLCIVYLSSPVESKLSNKQLRFDMLVESIKNTSKIFNKHDYIIFNEDFTQEHENKIKNIHSKCIFYKLDFKRNDLPFKKFARPKGYMLMCRFFACEVHDILSNMGYTHYIRFDDDSFLIEPFIEYNKFINIIKNNDYTFRTIFFDGQKKFNNNIPMQSLYNFTTKFLEDENKTIDYNYLHKINFLKNNLYTGLCPYNNFHSSSLKLWNCDLVKKYTTKIKNINGCLTNFWMDANIHSMIIFMLLPHTNYKLYPILNFGYRHNRHFSIINSYSFVYKSDEDFFPIEE